MTNLHLPWQEGHGRPRTVLENLSDQQWSIPDIDGLSLKGCHLIHIGAVLGGLEGISLKIFGIPCKIKKKRYAAAGLFL